MRSGTARGSGAGGLGGRGSQGESWEPGRPREVRMETRTSQGEPRWVLDASQDLLGYLGFPLRLLEHPQDILRSFGQLL